MTPADPILALTDALAAMHKRATEAESEINGTDPFAADPRKWGLRAMYDGACQQRDAATARAEAAESRLASHTHTALTKRAETAESETSTLRAKLDEVAEQRRANGAHAERLRDECEEKRAKLEALTAEVRAWHSATGRATPDEARALIAALTAARDVAERDLAKAEGLRRAWATTGMRPGDRTSDEALRAVANLAADRARADERKAWQEATGVELPDDARNGVRVLRGALRDIGAALGQVPDEATIKAAERVAKERDSLRSELAAPKAAPSVIPDARSATAAELLEVAEQVGDGPLLVNGSAVLAALKAPAPATACSWCGTTTNGRRLAALRRGESEPKGPAPAPGIDARALLIDQSVGERALREYKRRADLDSRLGDALRASGINAADALAVQALYATAGQSGSHRIVSALRAIEAWLREGGAL